MVPLDGSKNLTTLVIVRRFLLASLMVVAAACSAPGNKTENDEPRAGSCRELAEVCMQTECEEPLDFNMFGENGVAWCAADSCGADREDFDITDPEILDTPAGDAARWAQCFYDGNDTVECTEAAMACEG